MLGYAYAGSHFVFGELGEAGITARDTLPFGVLPTVIFIAAFFAVLYHFGIMQIIIRIFAWVMTRVMGASGAESLNVAASIFMGQTEAPLTIRPFLPDLTRSELMTVMTSGMAHVSGGIMAAYIAFGIDPKHLLSAVIMTAPGTLLMAKMLVPGNRASQNRRPGRHERRRRKNREGRKSARRNFSRHDRWSASGAQHRRYADCVSRADCACQRHYRRHSPSTSRWFPASLEQVFGAIFAPVAWVIGIPKHDCRIVGNLLGTRMVLNELVAFSVLGTQKATLDPRSFTIATFALCGFANLSSIGIQIGGIGALAPNKRGELARLGVRAMLAGTMANLMSASIAGMLL